MIIRKNNDGKETTPERQKLKVAAYVVVSADIFAQETSYKLLASEYAKRIERNPNCECVGVYFDEFTSDTGMECRKGLRQLIDDAKAGKVQHIQAKSPSRFSGSPEDCISIICALRTLNPPVGIHFDENDINTLDVKNISDIKLAWYGALPYDYFNDAKDVSKE